MTRLSISQAWLETLAFVNTERRLLTPLVLATIALPSAVLELIAPPAKAGSKTGVALLPEPGMWMFPGLILLVVILVGELALSRLALGWRGDLKGALLHALRRIVPLLGANLLFAVALSVPFLLLVTLAAAIAATNAGLGLIAAIVVGLPLLILLIRAAFALPTAAAEAGGPWPVLRRSFTVTQGESMRLLGFVLLFAAAALVAAGAISAIVGALLVVVLGAPEPWTVSAALIALVGGLVQGAIALIWVTMLSRCYAQLAASQATA